MKCDELKSLKNIDVAYNVTTGKEQAIAEYSDGNCHGFASDEEVYLKKDVDEAIAELKAKLRDHCIHCPVKMQEEDVIAEKDNEIAELKEFVQDAEYFKNLAESYHKRWLNAKKELDAYKLNIAAKDKEIAELKQKLESVQASMYCDVVDANMENRRLRRALWIARAKRAIEKIAWFKLCNANISTINPEDGARQEYDKWKKSLGKFLKKAEEYR